MTDLFRLNGNFSYIFFLKLHLQLGIFLTQGTTYLAIYVLPGSILEQLITNIPVATLEKYLAYHYASLIRPCLYSTIGAMPLPLHLLTVITKSFLCSRLGRFLTGSGSGDHHFH